MIYKVLFVCAGNICRSPLAEGIFVHMCREQGLEKTLKADSAGTGAWHVGERPDHRSEMVANEHGIELDIRSRQFRKNDFEAFDLILAMDNYNYEDLKMLANYDQKSKIKLMRDYDLKENIGLDVPDPYYGGDRGFEHVFEMLNISCKNLIQDLQTKLKL